MMRLPSLLVVAAVSLTIVAGFSAVAAQVERPIQSGNNDTLNSASRSANPNADGTWVPAEGSPYNTNSTLGTVSHNDNNYKDRKAEPLPPSGDSGREGAAGRSALPSIHREFWAGVLSAGTCLALISIPMLLTLLVAGLAGGFFLARSRTCQVESIAQDHPPAVEGSTLDEILGEDPTVSLLPEISRGPAFWGVGVASVVGPVRKENQDCATTWDQGPIRGLVVADGMGGEANGKEAARAATTTAARYLIESIDAGHFGAKPLETIRKTFKAAGRSLQLRDGISGGKAGLRTTLVVVVVTPDSYHWGYIGDGGLWIYRCSGGVENLLIPQKDPAVPNILHASLGPVTHGTPEVGWTTRRPGDVLFVASDGVVDRLPDVTEFSCAVIKVARDHLEGDLTRTAEEVLHQFEARVDEHNRPICDDNMTLIVTAPDNCDPARFQSVSTPPEVTHA